ncbi:MAG: PilT/PilU family type 4a pilus ATPase [Armatimonadetes bacterium]|jgi:twitching motility protein PilT|nr:PilT/PilU family type 4a pilus ATPase [Armatimonadota bacterium]
MNLISIYDLLEKAIQAGASDLLIKAGTTPAMRVDGHVYPTDRPVVTSGETEALAQDIIYTSSRDHLLQLGTVERVEKEAGKLNAEATMAKLRSLEEIDLVFTVPDMVRVRANLYLQQGSVAIALRIIPLQPRTLDELNLPPVLKDCVSKPQGLIIVTGPTGSGKSTTLAGLIEHINTTRAANVVTIEDPIEYVFTDKKSMIQQREVGSDTKSFSAALRAVLRQSPDVIMVGEMRDPETMEVALTAAEVGHLVLSTLHTSGAPQTIERILNSFSSEKRPQIAAQIGGGILCVASQKLVIKAGGHGRVPAVEVMTGSPTVRRYIETGELGPLTETMREGTHFGMQTFNMHLAALVNANTISVDTAVGASPDAAELRQMLRK